MHPLPSVFVETELRNKDKKVDKRLQESMKWGKINIHFL